MLAVMLSAELPQQSAPKRLPCRARPSAHPQANHRARARAVCFFPIMEA
jgi:hypothetical protein